MCHSHETKAAWILSVCVNETGFLKAPNQTENENANIFPLETKTETLKAALKMAVCSNLC